MKKFVSIVLILVMACSLVACSGGDGGKSGGKKTLKVYNAGEYMNLDLLDEFEEKYNCNIVYETFESNEMMYTKLSGGESYDILIPSDYMIERLIKEGYLQ